MPFQSGTSPDVFKSNIAEAFRSYKQKGSFGNSGPISPEDARKRILAAAYAKQRDSETNQEK